MNQQLIDILQEYDVGTLYVRTSDGRRLTPEEALTECEAKLNKYISENYMTGQQFYDRFRGNMPAGMELEPFVIEAAKRAAGITVDGESHD